MADNPPGPVDPEDHYHLQDEPPPPAAGSTRQPKPKPPRPPDRARQPRPARPPRENPSAAAAKPPFGGLFSWPKPQPMSVKHWIVFGVLLALLVGFAATMAIWQNQHQAWEDRVFGAAMNDYLAPTVPAAPGAPLPGVGKAVVVDVNKRALDYLQQSLPGELRAASPAEVTTVVQLHYNDQQVDTYQGGGKALKTTLTVTVVDRASHVVIGTKTFIGADPPQFTKASVGEDVRGDLPWKEVLDFVKQLRKG